MGRVEIMSGELQQAELLIKQKSYLAAEKIYRNILRVSPQSGGANLGMGYLALKANQPEKAVTFLNRACHALPDEWTPLIQLAQAFSQANSDVDALTVLNYAAERFSSHPQVHYELGQQQLLMGNLDAAEGCFRQALSLATDELLCHTLFAISRIKKFTNRDSDVALIEAQLSVAKTNNNKIVLHYALGKVFDDIGQYPLAWSHFEQANRLQLSQCEFRTSELTGFYQQIKLTSNRQNLTDFSPKVNGEITPIFILGLPRTGSTLLEQLLGQHRDISAAGELPYLSREVSDYLQAKTQRHFPHFMTDLSAEVAENAAKLYLQKLQKYSAGKLFVVDKLPANFQSIGLIYKLFPQAKVINLQRNIADVALSVFKNYFAESEPYFCDLKEFKQYNQLYMDLIQHWRTVLPGFVLDVTYEQLINDTEGTLRKVLSFCELQWDKDCLRETNANKAVRTLSNVQVRQPRYKTSLANWQNYKSHLSAFLTEEN